MEGTYEVYSAQENVGSVVVTRKGLFYHFLCRCDLTGEVMFRLKMLCDEKETDLGILTPVDGQFGVNTKMNIKNAGQGRPQFILKPNRNVPSEQLIRICPEDPFAYLSRLQDAYLVQQRNIMYIDFKNKK